MSVGLCLLICAVAVAVIAPPCLAALTHRGNAPRLGVAAWLTTIASMSVSGLVGVIALGVEFGPLALALVAATVTVVVSGPARGLLRARRRTHAHARDARLVARRVAGVDALVLDARERSAYCVAGRPSAVVVTSAALAALTGSELDAVLAHERAHLDGRHPQLLAVVRVLAESFPRVTLFTTGAAEVARLLEMCADDVATRAHGPRALLGGLLVLSGVVPAPAGGLSAGAVDVLDRAGRLATPVGRGSRARARVQLCVATTVVLALALVPAVTAVSGAMWCPPMVW